MFALAKKYASKRSEIFSVINDFSKSDEEKFEARLRLQSIPRNASPVRQRRRCALTGRPEELLENLALVELKSGRLQCVVKFQVLLKLVGNGVI